MEKQGVLTANFGKTGRRVTRVGLGGEGALRTFGKPEPACEVIRKALDCGIAYFDTARAYADSETYYGAVWSEKPRIRSEIFQAGKSAARDRISALRDLDKTLERLHTEYLDLWQIHDVRTRGELDQIAGPGGALEAFVEARDAGKVRYIGVTGHHDPAVLTEAVLNWPVDAAMMPVNPVEAALGGFITSTLPAALQKGIAVIGMKVLGASHYILPQAGISAEHLIRFALSCEITLAIVGCSTVSEVEVLARTARRFNPLSSSEMTEIAALYQPYAEQLAFYRGVI